MEQHRFGFHHAWADLQLKKNRAITLTSPTRFVLVLVYFVQLTRAAPVD